jgi:hypothetical protein
MENLEWFELDGMMQTVTLDQNGYSMAVGGMPRHMKRRSIIASDGPQFSL